MALPIPALVERARERLSRVTGLQPSSTLGVAKGGDSWRVSIEMVEKKSVPDGMDVLAIYEVLLDEEGNMLEFSRKKRRRRMDTDEDRRVEAGPTPLQQVVMNLAINFDPFFTAKEALRLRNAECGMRIEKQMSSGANPQSAIRNPESKIRDLNPRPTTRNLQSAIRNWQGGTETILLVEDEPMVLAVGQAALEHFGYRVLTAWDGEEAIRVYHEYRDEIRLVILDVVMPKLGGRETFRQLKCLNPTIKVLLATEGSVQERAEELLQEGLCGVVRKPYHIHELAQVVRAAVESAERVAGAATALGDRGRSRPRSSR